MVTVAHSYPLNIVVTPAAFNSWISSTRRLFKTFQCPRGHRAFIRRGHILCDRCRCGWPVDEVQDLIAELEVDQALKQPAAAASSRDTAQGNVPSLSTTSLGGSVSGGNL
jgi:hypothetical protein